MEVGGTGDPLRENQRDPSVGVTVVTAAAEMKKVFFIRCCPCISFGISCFVAVFAEVLDREDRPFREEGLLCSSASSCYGFSWAAVERILYSLPGETEQLYRQIKDLAQHPVSWQHPVTDEWGGARGHDAATFHLRGSNQSLSFPASFSVSLNKSVTTTILGSKTVLMLNYCSLGLKLQFMLPFLSDLPNLSGV